MSEIIKEKNLETVAGGYFAPDEVHNLNNFVTRTVENLPVGTCLQMQATPNGAFMSQMYYNGDAIFVNAFFTQNGYLLAFRNGIYGFVDASYVS